MSQMKATTSNSDFHPIKKAYNPIIPNLSSVRFVLSPPGTGKSTFLWYLNNRHHPCGNVFNITDDELKDVFDEMCKEAGISGINGHRSVGGYRASMYNALPMESVGVLVDIMSELEKKG